MTDDAVAGYRRVRALTETATARLVLVHTFGSESELAVDAGGAAASATLATTSGIRALKRLHSSSSVALMLSEAECLSRAAGEHTIAVDDLAAAADDSPILVLHWTGVGTLRRLLRSRQSLRVGEAITIIAPLVSALSRIHQSGVAIGDVGLDTVQFDEAGRPFFSEFSSAQLRRVNATPAEILEDTAFRADRRQLAAVAASVLAAVHTDRDGQRSIDELNDWLSDDATSAAREWDQLIEQRLFHLGAPEPLRLTADPITTGTDASAAGNLTNRTGIRGAEESISEARSLLALPPWLDGQVAVVVTQFAEQIGGWRRAIIRWCRPVRPRTWVIAVIGIVCVLAAGSIIALDAPAGGAAEESLLDPADSPSSVADTPSTEESVAETLSVDAEEALGVLLAARAACIRDLSVVCLEAISPAGTPAYVNDAALIEAVLGGAELPTDAVFDPSRGEKKQELGDSVLFEFLNDDTSKPASVLLVKGEAGWRLRSYTLPE